jgi:inhibitor of KinA
VAVTFFYGYTVKGLEFSLHSLAQMNRFQPYSIFPLGDSALTIDFGNVISESVNKKVLQLFHHLKTVGDKIIIDVVPAYSSLTIYYDVALFRHGDKSAFDAVTEILENWFSQNLNITQHSSNHFEIPVCYSKKFAIDIDHLSEHNDLSIEEIIFIHTSRTYRVYMLGFLPGFTYMGEVDPRIAIDRKPIPIKLPAGAVGIAGRQTGIYPLASPGGWQIIGRTPTKVFRKENKCPVLFYPGDEVKFYSISEDEFENYQARST